jgi:hypothetical protein
MQIFHLFQDEFEITGFDFHTLINEQRIIFNRGHFYDPTIKIHLEINEKSASNGFEQWSQNIQFDEMGIREANLDLFISQPSDTLLVSTDFLTLYIEEYNEFNDSIHHLLYSKNLDLDIHNLTIDNSNLYFHLDSIRSQSSTGLVEVNRISMIYLDSENLNIDRIHIDKLNFADLRDGNGLVGEQLTIEGPSADLNLHNWDQSGQSMDGILPKFIFDTIGIVGLEANVIQSFIPGNDTIRLQDIDLKLGQFNWNRGLSLSKDWFKLYDHLDLKSGPLVIKLPNEESIFEFQGLAYSNGAVLKIDQPAFRHIYSPETFSRVIDFQRAHLDIKSQAIEFRGLDLTSVIKNRMLLSNEMIIQDGVLYAYKDKNVPFNPEQLRSLPTLVLQQLDWPMKIDSIHVFNTNVTYIERPEDSNDTGKLTFNDLDATIKNLENLDSVRKDMTFSATGKLMNQGRFHTDVRFDLDDTTGKFYMDGRVGNMELQSLNGFMERSANVQIVDGTSRYIDFNYEGNIERARGEMRFYYRDLKLNILKEKANTAELKNKAFATFFANAFVVHKKNPRFLLRRNANIFYERDPQRGILDYWAKSILSGLAGSVGVLNTRKRLRKYEHEHETD